MTRIVFGAVVPCSGCDTTGKVRAPAMTKAETNERNRENKRRAAAKLPPLDRPAVMVDCPRCRGEGFIPRGNPEYLRSGIDVQ